MFWNRKKELNHTVKIRLITNHHTEVLVHIVLGP